MVLGHSPRLPFFFFNDPATTEIYTLSLHDALPISDLEGTMTEVEGLLKMKPQYNYWVAKGIMLRSKEIGRAHV